jgi:very-short-patch-repair endonuclease
MSSLDRHALEWLHDHHATISSEALRVSGVTLDQRNNLVHGGLLVRVVDGAYALGAVDVGELERCAALCTSRPELVVAGPTAGRLWGLRRAPQDGLIHVIAPPHSHPCRAPWVRAYRTPLLAEEEIVHRADGIRLTSPPRTVVDLTRYVEPVALESAIEHVLARRMCTPATLARTARQLATPGRPWVRRFLAVLEQRHPGAAAESEWELRVCNALLQRGVPDLERQVWRELPGYGRARFDIAIPDLRWALEIDIHPDHGLEGGAADKRRDRCARAIGWETERVGEHDLVTSFEPTIGDLVQAIRRRRAQIDALRAADAWPPGR